MLTIRGGLWQVVCLVLVMCLTVGGTAYAITGLILGAQPKSKPSIKPCTNPKWMGFEKDGWNFVYQCKEGNVLIAEEPFEDEK